MAIKNILVAFDGSEGAVAALRQGLRMAEKYGAHLTGLMPHGEPSTQITRMIAAHPELRDLVAQREATIMADAEEKFREDLFGGTTNSVLRHLPVPVLLAH